MEKSYQIEMLNVKDADAFIVYYRTSDNKCHLVLIDAGRYGDGEKVQKHLNTYYSGIPVELAIVTHPDDDHYGGFIYLLEQIKNKAKGAVKINKFWINDPRKHIKVDEVQESIQRTTLQKRLASIYSVGDKNLLILIEETKISTEEVFAGSHKVLFRNVLGYLAEKLAPNTSSQPCFIVLGPTKDYYDEVCKSFRYEHVHVVETSEEDDVVDEDDFKQTDECYSKVLDDAPDDGSDHNKSSIIVLFQSIEGDKILFTGDASVESFEQMDDAHEKLCHNVQWLKVPHHGSKSNLNSKWIKIFNPNTAYISTLRRGKYLSQCTINALKKNKCTIISTHNNQKADVIRHQALQKRIGWSAKGLVCC